MEVIFIVIIAVLLVVIDRKDGTIAKLEKELRNWRIVS